MSLPIVRQFVASVEAAALGVKVVKGVRPDQQLVKVVNDELIRLMGGQQEDLVDPKDGPQVRFCGCAWSLRSSMCIIFFDAEVASAYLPNAVYSRRICAARR